MQNRDLRAEATGLLSSMHHMKILNENYPIEISKAFTYTKDEVEMRKKHVAHEWVNSMKFYAQLVMPNGQEILQVVVHEVLGYGNASPI
ncbi:hypothetical protein ACFXTI_009388 [Malus domestica]